MATQGLGFFMPSETQYRNPSQYAQTLRAIGDKEATYLAQMDQFFSELTEMQRQFDVSTAQKADQFEKEMAFNESKLDWQSSESALDRSLERWKTTELTNIEHQKIGLSREQLAAQRESSQSQSSIAQQQLDLTREKNEFMRGLYTGEERRADEIHDSAFGRFSPSSSPSTGIVGTSNYTSRGTDWGAINYGKVPDYSGGRTYDESGTNYRDY